MRTYSIVMDLGSSIEELDGLGYFSSKEKARKALSDVRRNGGILKVDSLTQRQKQGAVLFISSDDPEQDGFNFIGFTKKFANR